MEDYTNLLKEFSKNSSPNQSINIFIVGNNNGINFNRTNKNKSIIKQAISLLKDYLLLLPLLCPPF